MNGVVRSKKPCVDQVPDTMHPGQVVLCRATRAQVTKHRGTIPIAVWECCGVTALSTWNEAWDLTDSMGNPRECPTPRRRSEAEAGCKPWDASLATYGATVSPGGRVDVVARLALPLPITRHRSTRSPRSSGKSSGLEQISLGFITVSVADVLPTQGFVNLTTFTTPDGPKDVFDVMMGLIDLASCSEHPPWEHPYTLKDVPPWPPIRVARREHGDTTAADDETDCPMFSIDNRRLFMLKVLGISSVEAEKVLWMNEFDSKLKQKDPPATSQHLHCRTDGDGVRRAQRRLHKLVQSRVADAALAADEAALIEQLARLNRQLKDVRAKRERLAADATTVGVRVSATDGEAEDDDVGDSGGEAARQVDRHSIRGVPQVHP